MTRGICVFRERDSERWKRKTCYLKKIYFQYLNQAKAKVNWFIVKEKSKPTELYSDFAIRHRILSFVPACVLSPLQRMQNSKCIFVLCFSAVQSGFDLVSVMSELRLSIYYLHYLTELMLFSILALNCFIWQVWHNCASFVSDFLLSHNDTLIKLFAVYRFDPVKRSSDFCAWSDIWNRYISTRESHY